MAAPFQWLTESDSFTFASLAIDAAIKGTVVLLLAGLATAFMRRFSAAVRHRTWCLTFAGLLLLPLLSYALPAWQIPVLPPAEELQLAIDPVAMSPAPTAAELAIAPFGKSHSDGLEYSAGPANWRGDLPLAMPEAGDAALLSLDSAVVGIDEGNTSLADAAVVAEQVPARSAAWSLSIVGMWGAGVALVLVPLIFGVLHSLWLGLRARRITDSHWTGLLEELRGRLHLGRRVTLLELQRPVIPMTWGVLRPVVIVPQSAQQWPERLRRFVLLHELAHVKRWDVPLQLLGRMGCAVYWFHPLAWYALRRLRIERELACDDYVVTTGERPSDYAEQLLQIVRTCRPAGFASVGVAMARTSHLEGRIRAMFDKARSHVPLSARAARILSLAAALLVTTVAVVRPAAREPERVESVTSAEAPADEVESVLEQPAPNDTETATAASAAATEVEPIRLQGRVVDADSAPIAEAKLHIVHNMYYRTGVEEVGGTVDLGATDADGRFDCIYEPDPFYGTAGELLLVTADGMGVEWMPVAEAAEQSELEFRLAADSVPIEGQILDLEGNPVAGVEVSIAAIRAVYNGDLTPYLDAVKANGGSNFQFDQHLFKPAHPAPQTTDGEGRFRFTGIGPNRVVDVELAGQGIHHARLKAVTRSGDPVVPADEDVAQRAQQYGESPVYGATFSYLVQPSRPIRGIVVDAETGAPLSGVHIGTLESRGRATSGADGRFELDGCAKADEYLLLASVADGQPYLVASQRVVDRSGLDPLEITFELTRGVAAAARVTDAATGKPVTASVSYWPAFPNTNMRPGIGGFEAHALGAFSESRTNREGEATVIVLPGAGFIGIRADDREAYETANVDAAAFFRERDVPYYSTVEMSSVSEPTIITAISDSDSSRVLQSSFHAIELLNIDAEDAGPAREVKLHPAGEKVASAEATLDVQRQSPAPAADAAPKAQVHPGTVVVDSAGHRIAGARVQVIHARRSPWHSGSTSATVLATLSTGLDGKYEFPRLPAELAALADARSDRQEWIGAMVTAPGHGFGYELFVQTPGRQQPITMTLPPAETIRGRVVDLEGRPVVGATIRVFDVVLSESSQKVDDWLAAIPRGFRSDEDELTGTWGGSTRQFSPDLFPQLVTDDDGRFELSGIGRDRIAVLMLNGPEIAQSIVQVLTRPLAEPVQALPVSHVGNTHVIYGSEFTVVAGPTAPVGGIVRDLDTRAPIAGAQVMLSSLAGTRKSHEGYIVATTDAEGRYELNGLPLGKGNGLKVVPRDQPYLITWTIDLPEIRGPDPIVRDIELPKAVWATGRLYDETTGEPVRGTVHFSPFLDNDFASRYPQYADQSTYFLGEDRNYPTDADGRFRIPVTPGHGVLCAKADNDIYQSGYGAERIDSLAPLLKEPNAGLLPTSDRVYPQLFHSLREINPPTDAAEITVDLPINPGLTLELLFVDEAGQPVNEVLVNRPKPMRPQQAPPASNRLTIAGLAEGTEITIQAQQRDRKLGARVDHTPQRDTSPQTIVLYPPVTVRGRLIDPQGVPVGETAIEPRWIHSLSSVSTDDTGAFTVELLAGDTYDLIARNQKYAVLVKELAANPGEAIDLGDLVIDPDGKPWDNAKAKHAPIVTKVAAETVPTGATKPEAPKLRPAATGAAMPAKPARPQSAVSAPTAAKTDNSPARDNEDSGSYSGQVTDDAGKPLPGAAVWLALSIGESDEGKLLRKVATSGEDGRFQFTLDPGLRTSIDSAQGHWASTLIAAAPGHGLGWFPLQTFVDNPEEDKRPGELKARLIMAFGEERIAARSLVLPPADRPVHGRLIDLEGAPRANVTVRVEWLRQPDIGLLLRSFAENSKQLCYDAFNAAGPAWAGIDRQPLRQLLPAVTTDADGRFEINGIGNDQLAALSFTGAGVESQVIHVLGRSMQPARIPHLDHYSQGTKDVFYGRDFSHAVGPSVPVEGVVKEFDSGAPVPNALVRVERLFAEGGGSEEGLLRLDTDHMRTLTDAQGRFRIDGMPPGIGHVLEVKPPKSEPLLMAEKPITLSATNAGAATIEIQVKRVLWIEGRITDKQTGEPVTAYVDHLALRTNPNTLDNLGLIQAFEMHRYQTDSDGRYRVPGLPGLGVIHVRAINDRGYPLAVGAETIDGYDKENNRLQTTHGYPLSNWNLVRQIDPPADAASFTCDLQLDAGQKITGTVVRPDGTIVTSFDALGDDERDTWWNLITDGQLTVRGYNGVGPRQLFFKTPDETLVGKLRLEGQPEEDLVVTLEPAVRVTGRLIEQETDLPADHYLLYSDSSSLGSFQISYCYTDNDGRFEIKGLIAGATYEMQALNSKKSTNGKNNFTLDLSQAKPGDVVEIGDVPNRQVGGAPVKPAAMVQPKTGSAESAASATAATPSHTDDKQPAIIIRGTVFDGEGRPVPDAFVAAAATLLLSNEPQPGEAVLGETTSGSDGRFEFTSVPAGSKFRIRSNASNLYIEGIPFDADQGTEIDLGDLWINDDGEVMEQPAVAAARPVKPETKTQPEG